MSLTKYVTDNAEVPTTNHADFTNLGLDTCLVPNTHVTHLFVSPDNVSITMQMFDCQAYDINAIVGLGVRIFGLEFDKVEADDDDMGPVVVWFDRNDGPVRLDR